MRIFVATAVLVAVAVALAAFFTIKQGRRAGAEAVEHSLEAADAAQSRLEELSFEKLDIIARTITSDADFVRYVAGPIELVGGLLGMVGLQTPWAAFLCSGLMAAGYWMAHGPRHLLPVLNGGELAALYCFVFLFIAARGAGIWSVDGPGSR